MHDAPPRAGGPARASTPPIERARRALSWPPLRIAGLYAACAITWIVLSDRVATALGGAQRSLTYQTAKGALFVVVTSTLLYVLVDRRERTLRELSRLVRATVEGMSDALLVVDQRLHVVDANRAAVELLGVERRDELLVPVDALIARFALRDPSGAPLDRTWGATRRALAGERVATREVIARRVDRRDVFLSITASPVALGAGRPRFAVLDLRDVSAARRLEELRDEFLSTAAHELKTPLAVIKAYAQLLQKRESAAAQGLVVIQRQVDRLNVLVQDLLDTSRLRLETGERHRERFDLAAVAREVVDRARPSAPAHALSVRCAAPAPILGERERIARVVSSLVENAIRFSPGGGPVAARVEARDGQAIFSVEDRGLGIPAERQARIFERFYRAHAGTPQDYSGLGLGLEMSREIVLRHGGRMWFESAQGEGSTFHFSLPLAGEDAA
jgi:signal transduction histidine kinase